MEHIPEKKTPILIVDDDVGFLRSIKAILSNSELPEPALVSDSRRVMDLLREHRFQFVLLDLVMPHVEGMDLLQQIKEEFPDVECVIVTAIDDISSAVQAMKYGAYDYLVKPLSSEKLIIVIKRALERAYLRNGLALFERKQSFSELKHPEAFENWVAKDEAMALVFRQCEVVAPTDYSVVITGESGTGKEMLAQTIHDLSNRAEGPFVAVNMAAVSNTLFKGELFGHSKGAYTGATSEKKGYLEAAQGGTLFLDEITDLEHSLQGGLLRVLQEREFFRLGSTQTRKVDVRALVATNKDIGAEIEKGNFRADLFHRLNMFHINIPPLRERKKDILPLARYFLQNYSRENNKNIQDLSPELCKRLMAYTFPGNIRELKNMIASAVLLEQSAELTPDSLIDLQTQESAGENNPAPGFATLQEMEKEHISNVLTATGGNRSQAAKILDIGRRTLQRKLKAYNLENKKGFLG